MLQTNVLSRFFCRDVIALVNKVLPIYIVFHLFEAMCVSTTERPVLPEASQGCEDELISTWKGLTVQ